MINLTKSLVALSAALITMAVLWSADAAQAQAAHALEVTVPFDFYAAGKLLPAGNYEAVTMFNNMVRLYNPTTRDVAAFPTMGVAKQFGEITTPKLVFNKYGADHFLSEMWWGRGSGGIAPIPTKVETELAKAARPIRIEARARR